jgi:hypothetical protein
VETADTAKKHLTLTGAPLLGGGHIYRNNFDIPNTGLYSPGTMLRIDVRITAVRGKRTPDTAFDHITVSNLFAAKP